MLCSSEWMAAQYVGTGPLVFDTTYFPVNLSVWLIGIDNASSRSSARDVISIGGHVVI